MATVSKKKDAAAQDGAKKTSDKILELEILDARDALDRSNGKLFVSGLSAGLDIGFSMLLIGILRTSAQDVLPAPVIELLRSTMYSFGFIVVVLGRSELFTEQTTLSVLPLLSGKTSLRDVAKLWGIVYVSNLMGTVIFAALAAKSFPAMGLVMPDVINKMAEEIVSPSGWIIFVSGLLAGWLMGLLSWLVAASRETISQVFIVWMITSAIGLAHLHHAILSSVEVLAGIFAGGTTTFAQYGHFLLFATLGNAVGGAFFVALIKYGLARPEGQQQALQRR